jgi:tetratricopeptide (TPR) repeat protein
MFKKYSTFLLAIAILLTGSLFTFAQQAPVRGKVELKKGDVLSPVVGATIDVYRTDVKSKLPSAKTDKKGFFVFAGLPLGATMVFVVSAPGIKAEMYPGVKAGREDVNITVSEGDGKNLTEDEVRSALSTAPKQGSGQTAEESAEAKKAREEYEKQVAEVTNKNKKIEDTNGIIKVSMEEGLKAFKEKNYDLAVAKFDEGIQADPDFVGSASVLNNNKASALRNRGVDAYNQGIKDPANKDSWREKAKVDFQNSVAASQKALDLISKITDSAEVPKYAPGKLSALTNIAEVRRLMFATSIDTSQPDELVSALTAYLAVETDAAAKTKIQTSVADALRSAGNTGQAVPIYRTVLETDPNNVEALGGLGLSLLNEGEIQGKIELSQEGLNLMQKFTEVAPDTHPLKGDVKAAVVYLKDEKKLVPQKVKATPGPAKGKKP